MKYVELCAKIDPNASYNSMPTAKLVKSLKKFSIFPEHIESWLIELKNELETYQDTLVPTLLDCNKNIKEFTEWKKKTITRVNDIIKAITMIWILNFLKSAYQNW